MTARALIENDDLKGELLQVEGLPTPDEVTYELSIRPETDEPNFERPADNEADARAYDEMMHAISRRRDDGDVWAWCIVFVAARWTSRDGTKYAAWDTLGGCSYANEADFKQPGGYYDDMKRTAYDALLKKIEASHQRQERAAGVRR